MRVARRARIARPRVETRDCAQAVSFRAQSHDRAAEVAARVARPRQPFLDVRSFDSPPCAVTQTADNSRA
jgi:hypothetical protein